ncbi:MAG: ATP-dependent helicase [Bacteroidota bacterium]
MKLQLNEQQEKAVKSDSDRILCLAGAGTGKTRVLTSRIAYLNREHRVGTSNMLALTFTRYAAKEMKERLMELVGERQGKNLFAGTFHSWCVSVLREYHHLHNRERNFTIYGEEDRRALIKSVDEDLGYEYSVNEVIEALNTPGEMDEQDSNLLRVVQEYEYRMRQNNAFDLDMLLTEALNLISENEEVKQDLRKEYKHIFVDEFQDTDDIQFSILKHLDPNNLFVVGDDYQSIYGWRNANPQNIIDLSEHPDYEVIKLEKNYRCTIPACAAANTLIKNNENRTEKDIKTDKEGPEIIYRSFEDETAEAKEIGITIAGNTDRFNYSDFAILARTNYQIYNINEVLSEMNIPTFIVSNRNDIFKKYHIRRLLNWIETALNPEDSNHLKRVINFPKTRISELKLEELELEAMENSKSFYEVLEQDGGSGSNFFIKQLEKTRDEFYKEKSLAEQISNIALRILSLIEVNKEKGLENRVEDITEMLREIKKWEDVQRETGEPTGIDGFLEWIRTKDIQDRLAQEEAPGVRLMTVHGAKGLEFPVVFVAGLNQGLFPHKRSDIEEERRLFYVAVTRAQERLVLTRPELKKLHGDKMKRQEESQFINEMGGWSNG